MKLLNQLAFLRLGRGLLMMKRKARQPPGLLRMGVRLVREAQIQRGLGMRQGQGLAVLVLGLGDRLEAMVVLVPELEKQEETVEKLVKADLVLER